jgi:hypothetical protein
MSYANNTFESKGNIGFFGGYESNIFRNTHDMEYAPSLGGGAYDPVTGDGIAGWEIYSRSDINLNKTNRLTLSFNGDYQLYPHNMSYNQSQGKGEIEYRLRPKKTITLKFPVGGGYIRKLGVDEGSDETTLYEYWALDAGPRVEIIPFNKISMTTGYTFSLRNYQETGTTTSLDNTQHEISLAFEPIFGAKSNNTLIIESSYMLKKYLELGSYDSSGILYEAPFRTYHYGSAEITFKHDFGFIKWNIGYRPKLRADAFQSYYTYFENRISSGITADFKSRTSLSVNGAWRYRHYPVHPAEQLGTAADPDLVIRYFDLSTRAEQMIRKRISAYIEYDLKLRRTNTGIPYFHTYRNYTDHTIKAGTSVSW